MSGNLKSKCPINLALELLGDRWTLLIIRDMMFANKSNFREFLLSEEGISSRTLAERLQTLQRVGIVTRHGDPNHKLKTIYRLTPAGLDLLPILAHLGYWGTQHRSADPKLGAIAENLISGGPQAMGAMKRRLALQQAEKD